MQVTPEILFDLICQVVRYGRVCARNDATMRVKVQFEDTAGGAIVTDWLQVAVPRSFGDAVYDLPDIDTEVICLFLPHGRETGFVIGCVYGGNEPPASSGDVYHRTFKDGTVIEYDRAAHHLKADVVGSAAITTETELTGTVGTSASVTAADFIRLTAPNIFLNGNTTSGSGDGESGTVTAKENAHRTINGSLVINGPLTVNGDAAISGNSSVGGNSDAGSRSGGVCPHTC